MEKEQVIVWVRVQPNASRNEVLGFKNGVLRVRIAAPPIKGKANQELIQYFSHILGIKKSTLTIAKGATSKRKALGISGLTPDQVREQLAKLGMPKKGRPPV